jgi:general secretion pathway protein D
MHEIRMKPMNIKWRGLAVIAVVVLMTMTGRAQPQPGTFGGFNFGGNTGNQSTGTRSTSSRSGNYPSSTDIGQARITYDAETRSLIVVADEETAQHITNVVAQLDRPAPQVLIKCVFLEVTYSKGSDIGVSGSYTKNLSPSTFNSTVFEQSFSGLAGLASGAGMFTVIADDFTATIRAIAEAGKIEVLSRPSVLARNNQQASITIGQRVPLISGVTFDNFGNQRNAITYQNVGIILQVTPFITSDGMVEMVVAPEISSVSDSSVNFATGGTNGSSGASAPIINTRSADTVVVTPDNQTIVIGGLMSTRKTESASKIPILGDIPLLGAAFRRKVKNDEKTELLIFLTPTIVRDPRELAMATDTERARMQSAPKAFSEQELNRFLDKAPSREETPETKSLKPKK